MFGYVIARKDTLSETRLARYRGCYCGLCHALKERYGNLHRLALNYDMTFLILVLSSLYEPEERRDATRCVIHPAKPQAFWLTEFSDYAADLTVALTYHKLRDDWLDEGARLKKGLMNGLQGAYDRVKARLPRQCALIEAELDTLLALEKAGEAVPDKCAAAFGRLMAGLFVEREDHWSPVLWDMGFFLGQFIYLQDAAVDLAKDAKKGRYNPLLLLHGGQVKPLADFEPMLLMVAAQCAAAFDRLPLVQDADLLKNILFEGIWTRYHEARARQEKNEKEGTPA
ncbi:MAG: hypothetical protein IKU58_02665 [Clostridia bacterium]|nr:hypothetical protein [Clostridia bacterium]